MHRGRGGAQTGGGDTGPHNPGARDRIGAGCYNLRLAAPEAAAERRHAMPVTFEDPAGTLASLSARIQAMRDSL